MAKKSKAKSFDDVELVAVARFVVEIEIEIEARREELDKALKRRGELQADLIETCGRIYGEGHKTMFAASPGGAAAVISVDVSKNDDCDGPDDPEYSGEVRLTPVDVH